MINNHIFLIGFMGAGKTSLGKQLAKKLNLKFLDSDKEIESLENMPVSQIFATHGESYFRKLEHDWLNSLSSTEFNLISTGGGMPCFENNIDVMRRKGLVIYLKHPPRQLVQRLRNAKTERPLLKNKTPKEIEEFITKLLSEREPIYSQAHIIVCPSDQRANTVRDLIVDYTK